MKRMGIIIALFGVGLAILAGCSKGPTEAPPASKSPSPATSEKAAPQPAEHGHKPGAHGSRIVEIGGDNYHAEAAFEKDGVLKLFMLGKDESRIQEIDAQTLDAYIKPEGGMESIPFTLEPMPRKGDSKGKTSLFAGKVPKEFWGKPVQITIPSITIAGERFRVAFQSPGHDEHGMPQGVARGSDKERELYLKPGGIYTQADIEANGNMIPSAKFEGIMWSHDDDLKKGDKVCPVTTNKADPRCNWIVAGKKYEFCCPPCLDKFVKWAKTSPEKIKEPGEYDFK